MDLTPMTYHVGDRAFTGYLADGSAGHRVPGVLVAWPEAAPTWRAPSGSTPVRRPRLRRTPPQIRGTVLVCRGANDPIVDAAQRRSWQTMRAAFEEAFGRADTAGR